MELCSRTRSCHGDLGLPNISQQGQGHLTQPHESVQYRLIYARTHFRLLRQPPFCRTASSPFPKLLVASSSTCRSTTRWRSRPRPQSSSEGLQCDRFAGADSSPRIHHCTSGNLLTPPFYHSAKWSPPPLPSSSWPTASALLTLNAHLAGRRNGRQTLIP